MYSIALSSIHFMLLIYRFMEMKTSFCPREVAFSIYVYQNMWWRIGSLEREIKFNISIKNDLSVDNDASNMDVAQHEIQILECGCFIFTFTQHMISSPLAQIWPICGEFKIFRYLVHEKKMVANSVLCPQFLITISLKLRSFYQDLIILNTLTSEKAVNIFM